MSIDFETSPKLSNTLHGLSLRHGGVSSTPFNSLNFASYVGDNPSIVDENYKRLLVRLGKSRQDIVSMEQVHSANVSVVTTPTNNISNCDGVLTSQQGLLLTGFFADCVPIFFYDPNKQVVGLAHAGWRGTLKGIAKVMIDKMKVSFNSLANEVQVFIGPSIKLCCYEVDNEVINQLHKFSWWEQVTVPSRPSHYYLDLALTNKYMLLNAGVTEENIDISAECTSCNEGFFSHRRDAGVTGRMLGFISLR